MIKNLLINLGIYEKVRWSKLFYLIYYIRNRNAYKVYKAEIQFYKRILKNVHMPIIFDVGANVGDSTMKFLQLKPKKIIQFEPDMKNIRILEIRYSNNKRVILEPLALSNVEGENYLNIIEEGSGYNTLSTKWRDVLEDEKINRWKSKLLFQNKLRVKTTTLNKMIDKYGQPNYIKIDVEGHEESCIKGLSYPISIISFECNLPEFLEETISCINLINKIKGDYVFNYSNNGNTFINLNFHAFKEAIDFVSNTRLRYFEVYAILN